MRICPEERNKGIGSALMNRGESALANVTHVLLSAYRRDERAVNFYKKRGFEEPENPLGRWDEVDWSVPRRVLMIQLQKNLQKQP